MSWFRRKRNLPPPSTVIEQDIDDIKFYETGVSGLRSSGVKAEESISDPNLKDNNNEIIFKTTEYMNALGEKKFRRFAGVVIGYHNGQPLPPMEFNGTRELENIYKELDGIRIKRNRKSD